MHYCFFNLFTAFNAPSKQIPTELTECIVTHLASQILQKHARLIAGSKILSQLIFILTDIALYCCDRSSIRHYYEYEFGTVQTKMTVRKYGPAPYQTAVLHGGPGAPGYMAPVARELSAKRGVVEPLQSAATLDWQIQELKNQLDSHCDLPATLIGSSWGAILALLLAAHLPEMIRKLILVGSAVFNSESSAQIENIRMSRLSEKDRLRHAEIQSEIRTADQQRRNVLMSEWGKMLDKTDMHDPITTDIEVIETQYDVFTGVWPQFTALRDKPGYLKSLFTQITAPVVVIHGAYDPHPIDGIRPFLESCLRNVVFHILPDCGHYPWIERNAKAKFYKILEGSL